MRRWLTVPGRTPPTCRCFNPLPGTASLGNFRTF
jgi:hypothetical protein